MDRYKEVNAGRGQNEENPGTARKTMNRKPPVIKQTLTSMYRIAKANPLLLIKDDKVKDNGNDFGLSNIKLPKSILQFGSINMCDSDKPSNKEQPLSGVKPKKPAVTKSTPSTNQKSALKHEPFSRTASLRVNKATSSNVALQRTASTKVKLLSSKIAGNVQKKVPPSTSHTKAKPSNVASNPQANTMPTKRRSLSAEHYDRKRKLSQPKIEQLFQKKEVTQSLNDIEKKFVLNVPVVSPILEHRRVVTFRTPSAYQRRSVSFSTPTPYNKCPTISISYASTPTPTQNELKSRLEKWLQKHKKPIHSYHHLKCFGFDQNCIKNGEDDENKENIEDTSGNASSSYEDLKIETPKQSSGSDMRTIAQAALTDLHKLIIDGYSHEQCEAWLGRIRYKYRHLEEEPQYWECRAAIEQTRGNITSAVECLRAAIVQGAEVKAVDHSLEQLLQKFSLLNLSTGEASSDKDRSKKDRARIVLDARNVFKSSIIQFAVQERTMKKKQLQEQQSAEKRFIVTPVRRSTRSRSGYVLTPGVRVCSSIHELNSRELNFEFQGNSALCVNFSET